MFLNRRFGGRARSAMLTMVAMSLIVVATNGAAQTLAGSWHHVVDSDGTRPKAGATVTLTFVGGRTGSLRVDAVQPGQTLEDSGRYAVEGRLITISFSEMEWAATRQPFEVEGCRLTLPFKALSAEEGVGTSIWEKTTPECTGKVAADRASRGGGFASFSADEVVTTGPQHLRRRVFVAERAMRTEAEQDGGTQVLIVRLDKNVLWSLSPDAKSYTEVAVGFGGNARFGRQQGASRHCRSVGQEEVAGCLATKEECRIPAGRGDQLETRWVCGELGGIVVKQVAGPMTLELRNIKRGAVAPALFELPAGIRKVDP